MIALINFKSLSFSLSLCLSLFSSLLFFSLSPSPQPRRYATPSRSSSGESFPRIFSTMFFQLCQTTASWFRFWWMHEAVRCAAAGTVACAWSFLLGKQRCLCASRADTWEGTNWRTRRLWWRGRLLRVVSWSWDPWAPNFWGTFRKYSLINSRDLSLYLGLDSHFCI